MQGDIIIGLGVEGRAERVRELAARASRTASPLGPSDPRTITNEYTHNPATLIFRHKLSKNQRATMYLRNTNNVHVQLSPLHSRYAWTTSEIVGKTLSETR